jgi:hypothetical protein
VGNLLDNLEVYWTLTFGNHDSETIFGAVYDRQGLSDKIQEEFADSPYCLFKKGSVYGTANQVINVKGTDGAIRQSVLVVDSNDYVTPIEAVVHEKGLVDFYDCVHQDQLDFFKAQYAKGNIKDGALAYLHIPFTEFDEIAADDARILIGVREEDSYSPLHDLDDNTYKVFKEIKVLSATVGHDHINSFIAKYEDMYIGYTQTSDYFSYKGIANRSIHGGLVTTLTEDGTVYMQQVFADSALDSKQIALN